MFFKQPELTSGSRPILQQDETLLFVQNSVGLYEGKSKIAGCQNGHAYLTSHRICYIDDVDPRNHSLAVDLRDVERQEHQAGFLRSSAKITIYPKPVKRGLDFARQSSPSSLQRTQSPSLPSTRTGSPFRPSPIPKVAAPTYSGSWTCKICSFSNPVPSNFDASNTAFPLPPCLTCGIKPEFPTVLKAAIAAASRRSISSTQDLSPSVDVTESNGTTQATPLPVDSSNCPQCTYQNHVSLNYCEICGAPLPRSLPRDCVARRSEDNRSQSPGPEISNLNLDAQEDITYIKMSFRAGGDKIFQERLKNALIQRKWLTASAPPAPRPLDALRASENTTFSSSGQSSPERSSTPIPSRGVGIAGLERRGLQSRETNEAVIGTAFSDLETLMASARDIVALAEQFSQTSSATGTSTPDPILSRSAAQLGMVVATKDTLSDTSTKLYISELARNLAEYVSDSHRGLLRQQGGVMSLVDLWADFNRSRNGVELVAPSDFHKAAETWSTLQLTLRLRKFKSGLLVVQQIDQTDERTILQITTWLKSLRSLPSLTTTTTTHSLSSSPIPNWDHTLFSHGITAQDAAQKFGWSLGVASEELEMAEERGALCREDGVQGLKFWLNFLIDD